MTISLPPRKDCKWSCCFVSHQVFCCDWEHPASGLAVSLVNWNAWCQLQLELRPAELLDFWISTQALWEWPSRDAVIKQWIKNVFFFHRTIDKPKTNESLKWNWFCFYFKVYFSKINTLSCQVRIEFHFYGEKKLPGVCIFLPDLIGGWMMTKFSFYCYRIIWMSLNTVWVYS